MIIYCISFNRGATIKYVDYSLSHDLTGAGKMSHVSQKWPVRGVTPISAIIHDTHIISYLLLSSNIAKSSKVPSRQKHHGFKVSENHK